MLQRNKTKIFDYGTSSCGYANYDSNATVKYGKATYEDAYPLKVFYPSFISINSSISQTTFSPAMNNTIS
eukprot:56021-Hanusia_phi.AAC.1